MFIVVADIVCGVSCAAVAATVATPDTTQAPLSIVHSIQDERASDSSPTARLKSLDELLGLVVAEEGIDASTTDRSRPGELDHALSDGEPVDRMRKVQHLLEQASEAIGEADYSLATQRLQERAAKMIDDLLADAERQQQQRQSSSSSGSSSGNPQQQDGQGGQSPQDKMADKDGSQQAQSNERDSAKRQGDSTTGEQRGDQMPDRVDGDAAGAMEATAIEWGSLPPRVRDVLRQGLRERMSTPYRAWTEAYFRRIAEESRR